MVELSLLGRVLNTFAASLLYVLFCGGMYLARALGVLVVIVLIGIWCPLGIVGGILPLAGMLTVDRLVHGDD